MATTSSNLCLTNRLCPSAGHDQQILVSLPCRISLHRQQSLFFKKPHGNILARSVENNNGNNGGGNNDDGNNGGNYGNGGGGEGDEEKPIWVLLLSNVIVGLTEINDTVLDINKTVKLRYNPKNMFFGENILAKHCFNAFLLGSAVSWMFQLTSSNNRMIGHLKDIKTLLEDIKKGNKVKGGSE